MKRVLRTLSLAMALCMVLAMTACGGSNGGSGNGGNGGFQFKNRIEIMIPAGEGGGLDTTMRKFSTYLEKELGTSITITNRSGGSGVTGFTWSHNSTNDGYAYQFTAPSAIIAAAQGNFDFDLMSDLIPVSGLVMAEGMLFTNKNTPFKTAQEMIDYAKAHPEGVSVAVDTPNGITGAILTEFEQSAGIKLKWVTSESGEDTISVIAGDIDMTCNTWSDTGAYVESGDLIPLIVMADQRNELFPDVPCTKEMGYTSTLGFYRVFTALKGTPQEAVDAFGAAVRKVATENTEWHEWLAANGMTNDYLWDAETLKGIIDNTYNTAKALNS